MKVVGRYKGKNVRLGVVNEVIEPADGPSGMRNSLWYQIAGEEYIEKAFEYAHAADPDAKLFINDYNTHQPEKRQYLHDLIKRLKDKGIPVDGIGHQCISISKSVGAGNRCNDQRLQGPRHRAADYRARHERLHEQHGFLGDIPARTANQAGESIQGHFRRVQNIRMR